MSNVNPILTAPHLGKVREFCFSAARSDGQRGFAVPPLDQLQSYRVRGQDGLGSRVYSLGFREGAGPRSRERGCTRRENVPRDPSSS